MQESSRAVHLVPRFLEKDSISSNIVNSPVGSYIAQLSNLACVAEQGRDTVSGLTSLVLKHKNAASVWLLAWRPSLLRLEAIAIKLEAIAITSETSYQTKLQMIERLYAWVQILSLDHVQDC